MSAAFLPLLVGLLLLYAAIKGVPAYSLFLEGARDGLKTALELLPTLMGLMIAIAVVRAGGLLEGVEALLTPLLRPLGVPPVLLPLWLMRLISASGASSLALDIFARLGPDSFAGRAASILLGCTETLFYTLSLYCLHVGVTRTRYILPCALLISAAGLWAALVLA